MECNIFIGEVQVPGATGRIETMSLFEALKQVKDLRGRGEDVILRRSC